MRLFCLPYSGASAMVYLRWRRAIPSWVSVHPLELPGRGARRDEPFAQHIEALAQALADQIGDTVAQPYALFGHSMGALLAYELAHVLAARGLPPPAVTFVSGAEAPACRDPDKHARERSDDELRELLRDLGGTSDIALQSDELMDMVLPVLRADLRMCGRYRPPVRAPLHGAVHVFGGRDDAPSAAALDAWRRETRATCAVEMFDGGHFFVHQQEARLLRCIEAALHPTLQTTS
ncbi:thioesterase II family protein [Cupriavidus pauculus]|nr:alpha/beta fold hydrolase [Cupriavidus pauculus]